MNHDIGYSSTRYGASDKSFSKAETYQGSRGWVVQPLPTTGPIVSWHKTGQDNVAPELREQVQQYRHWLAQQSHVASDAQERADYALTRVASYSFRGKRLRHSLHFGPTCPRYRHLLPPN